MGIGDRAYMRTPPAAREPLSATVWTLGVLVVFFIAELIQESAGAHFLKSFELAEAQPRIWQWLTHALLHDDFWHLLGNALVLWWTGAMVENTYGRKVFFTVLLSGVFAGASIWWLTGLGGARAGSSLIGISAGVYALMLVALLDKLEHQITVLLFFFLPVTLKVRWVLGVTALLTALGWIFSELPSRHVWSGWAPAWQDTIAHSAHLGGLIFGWFAWRRLNRTNEGPSYAHLQMETNAPSPDLEAKPRLESLSSPSKAQARAQLDGLLDKISAGGFGSLTPEEKHKLEDLSARLR